MTTCTSDNYSTAMNHYRGQFDAQQRVLRLEATVLDPFTGEERAAVATYHLSSADHFVYRDWALNSDGKEFVTVEIEYRRVKAAATE